MRVLVCEDEEVIREFVVINLMNAGFTVFPAGSGEEALDCYTAEQGAFDIILLDIMMPGLDGIQVLQRLRAAGCQAGIIMLSAKAQLGDIDLAMQSGADDYITKPFAPSDMMERVERLYRKLHSEV